MRDAIGYGVLALGLCVGLGAIVCNLPPLHFDIAGEAFGGVALPLAAFLTRAGLFPVYATICACLLVLALVRREYLASVAIAVIGLAIVWQASDAMKAIFRRPRPEHWFAFRETSYSYPSGHAVLATAFYGFGAFLVWRSALPFNARLAIVAAIALWILAIGWSRLALGAHFPSDLLGGYLLGISAVCFEIAVALRASKKRIEVSGEHALPR